MMFRESTFFLTPEDPLTEKAALAVPLEEVDAAIQGVIDQIVSLSCQPFPNNNALAELYPRLEKLQRFRSWRQWKEEEQK